MKIATFNANSIRIRSEIVLEWLVTNEPDILAIQETKCEDDKFPREMFEESGYNVLFHGQKSYNGVAILSKSPATLLQAGFGDVSWPEDCRILLAEIDGIAVLNTYAPNGTKVGSDKFKYKLDWFIKLRELMDRRMDPRKPCVWIGDINVAPKPEDVFDSAKMLGHVCHHPDEFKALAHALEWGWTDCFRKFTPEAGHFTYWEFVIPNAFERNRGWRIDHIYASPALEARCISCTIDRGPRQMERPSDHTVVVAEFA